MNGFYSLPKVIVFIAMATFSTMHGAGKAEITIAYDTTKIKEVKKTFHDYVEQTKNVSDLLHAFEDPRQHLDKEWQFIVFKKINDLLSKDHILVNTPDGGGKATPLYNAVRFDLEAFAVLFIAYGAEIPENQNDEHHPLKADQYATREGHTRQLVQDYIQAKDKEAFRKEIQQRLNIPGIALFERTTTPQPTPLPEPQGKPSTSQSSSSQQNNKTLTFGILSGVAICTLIGISYALYNRKKPSEDLPQSYH